jgi:hypothetical protein
MIKLSITEQLKQFVRTLQGVLFPNLEEELGPLTPKHQQIVAVLNLIDIDAQVPAASKGVGRPPKNRRAIASAFVAKAVFNFSTTRQLLDLLKVDVCLRRICGWEGRGEIPDESVFSRAFAEFAKTELAQRLHATLIEETQKDRLIGHISRDSTEIEAREKPERPPVVAVAQEPEKPQRKRGRRKNNEPPPLPGTDPTGAAGCAGKTGFDDDRTNTGGFTKEFAAGLQRGHQEEQQGLQGNLDRLQAPFRRGRRADSHQLHSYLGLLA